MVIYKENPVGIDVVVRRIQKALESKLSWANLIDIYPRCYPVIRDNLRTIECYEGNGDYGNLIFAEQNKCFIVQASDINRLDNNNFSTELELYFTLDLGQIFVETGRRDAEVHRDVLKALDVVPQVIAERLITRIERVFDNYTFSVKEDMQPYHCFKVLITVNYFDPNEKCCDC